MKLLLNQLDSLVSQHGVFAVLDALSGVCGKKSEQVVLVPGKEQIADDWRAAESAIDVAASLVLDLFKQEQTR